MPDTHTEAAFHARAVITTNEPWDPAMGWEPDAIKVDESFDHIISEIGREGVTWIRTHVSGNELWLNLANVVSIGREASHHD